FQEAKIPYGSLDIDSLNLSNAELSVSFPKAKVEVIVDEVESKEKRSPK
ncbi:hypothetical protein A2U01_0027972, partial [Trifolium medium]|nr:hypothetical protein [Trifolium medium]